MKLLPWLICCLLLFALLATMATCKKHQDNSDQLAFNLKHANDKAHFWQDAAGRAHAEKLQLQGSMPDIEAVKGALIDSVSKALKTKKQNIETITTASVVSQASVMPHIDTVTIDNTKTPKLEYRDRWIDISYVIAKDSVLTYKTFDSLILTSYSKRTGLFKRSVYVDAYSINPHSSITGVIGIKVHEEKNKRFGLGPFIGYGYDGNTWKPAVGISIQYSLIKF